MHHVCLHELMAANAAASAGLQDAAVFAQAAAGIRLIRVCSSPGQPS